MIFSYPTSTQQARQFVEIILSKVSRTFALNIKVLRKEDYDFIACCYLICRTIDTIEDSTQTSPNQKIKLLHSFHEVFKKSSDPKNYEALILTIIPTSSNESEKELLEKFHWVMYLYHRLPSKLKKIGQPPILKMAEGMSGFIELYSYKKKIVLKSEKEMEQYCYYVAGTVGELLTDLFKQKISSKKIKEILNQKKNAFGLGLQMTNIAKDFQRDGERGWTYIPESYLRDEKISREEFLSGSSNDIIYQKTKKVHLRFIEKAITNLNEALIYTQTIPKNKYRYRLFCFIPLFLAIKTTSFIKKQKIDRNFKDKISRKDVYLIVFYSYISTFSNFFSKKVYNRLKK